MSAGGWQGPACLLAGASQWINSGSLTARGGIASSATDLGGWGSQRAAPTPRAAALCNLRALCSVYHQAPGAYQLPVLCTLRVLCALRRVYHKPLALYCATEAAGRLAYGLLWAMGFAGAQQQVGRPESAVATGGVPSSRAGPRMGLCSLGWPRWSLGLP